MNEIRLLREVKWLTTRRVFVASEVNSSNAEAKIALHVFISIDNGIFSS